MSASEMSVETLKKSLAANGLAQDGTKEQMLHRLLTGGTEKKKPGPKPKGDVPKKNTFNMSLRAKGKQRGAKSRSTVTSFRDGGVHACVQDDSGVLGEARRGAKLLP